MGLSNILDCEWTQQHKLRRWRKGCSQLLVHEGLGPQNYSIRELEDFLGVAHLEDDGDFDLTLESGESSDEFYIDSPCLRAAENEHLLRKFTDPTFDNPNVRKVYAEAVERERTRLLVSGRDFGE